MDNLPIQPSQKFQESQVPTDRKERAIAAYDRGQAAFEGGEYRQAVVALEEAMQWAHPNSRLGGEIGLWLVNAYSAANEPQRAQTLCEVLTRHPDWDTRKQGKRLLYILKAPRLKLKAEWQTQIPDLTTLEAGGDRPSTLGSYNTRPRRPSRPAPEPEPEDLSQINTQDNGFLWAALGAIALLLAGLAWWA